VLQEDIKTILGKNRLELLCILWQLGGRVLGFCAASGFFCQVLRVGGHSLEVGNYGFWEYLCYEQVVSKFPVFTIGAGGRGLVCIIFQEQGGRSASTQIKSIELCFPLLVLFLVWSMTAFIA